jgi:hypothetical protein
VNLVEILKVVTRSGEIFDQWSYNYAYLLKKTPFLANN